MKKILAAPITDKGGSGKSFTAQILRETLRGPESLNSVQVIDSDVGNSSMAQIDPTAKYAGLRDANDVAAQGVLARGMKDLADGTIDALVWDTAAGIEKTVREDVLPSLLVRARKAKIAVICFRLVTTSQYTQDGAVDFAKWGRENGVAVVYVRNLGQGRAARYFREWEELEERRKTMPPAVEVILPDLGCWIADEAASLGLGLGDIAVGDFSRLSGRALEVAQSKFSEDVQLGVADYLEMRRIDFEQAMEQAVSNLQALAE
jgi:hypothetical protein